MKNLLLGITQANHFLLKENHFGSSLQGVVNSLGENTGFDRCYIFKNEIEKNIIKLYYSYEWCAKGISHQINNPELNGLTYDEFPGFYNLFIEDKPFNAIVSKMDESDLLKDILSSQQIKTILILPILVNSNLWGWIGLDDCKNEKEWQIEEIYALHSVARNIGLRISQENIKKNLEDTLETFDFYMKGSNQAMWQINLENNEVNFSYNWMGMLGYEPFEFEHTFENWRIRVHPDEIEGIMIKLRDYISGKADNFEGIQRLQHKKGHYKWIKYSGLLKKNKNGNPLKIIGTHIDISELKEKEITIVQKSQELLQIIENIDEVAFRLDNHHKITFLSPFWEKMTGYKVEDSIGKKVSSFLDKENLLDYENNLHKISRKSNLSFEIELKLKTKKQIKWVSLKAKSYKIDNSILIAGRFSDINDRKIARENLMISERKFRFLAENTTDLITIINLDGTFGYVSNSVKQITGYSQNVIISKHFKDFIHPEDIFIVNKAFFDLTEEGENNKIITYRFKSKSGTYIWLETSYNILLDFNNVIIGRQCSSRDVSERIKIKNELEVSLEKQKQLNLLKSSFVSTVSHQFRTPLTVIYSNIELIELSVKNISNNNLTTRINIVSERIKNEVGRMTEMMDNILLFGKYEAGKIAVKPQKVNPVVFIEKIISTYFSKLEDDRRIDKHFNINLRDITIDEQLTTHVINNLLSNAIKYSFGSKNPLIEIDSDNYYTSIKIIDFGIGIPEEDMDKLFNSFFRASNTSTFEGYGLGLVIAKEFTEIQNGTIEIKSNLNIGTTVTLKFPNL
jgi:PAS domain S-box-containing protein